MRSMRLKRVLLGPALIAAAAVGMTGCRVEANSGGLAVVCEPSDYVVSVCGLGVCHNPVNPFVGLFCGGFATP